MQTTGIELLKENIDELLTFTYDNKQKRAMVIYTTYTLLSGHLIDNCQEGG